MQTVESRRLMRLARRCHRKAIAGFIRHDNLTDHWCAPFGKKQPVTRPNGDLEKAHAWFVRALRYERRARA